MSDESESKVIKKTICIDEQSHDLGLKMAAMDRRSFSNFIDVLLYETAVARGLIKPGTQPEGGKVVPLALLEGEIVKRAVALVEEEIVNVGVVHVAAEQWDQVKSLKGQS